VHVDLVDPVRALARALPAVRVARRLLEEPFEAVKGARHALATSEVDVGGGSEGVERAHDGAEVAHGDRSREGECCCSGSSPALCSKRTEREGRRTGREAERDEGELEHDGEEALEGEPVEWSRGSERKQGQSRRAPRRGRPATVGRADEGPTSSGPARLPRADRGRTLKIRLAEATLV